MSGFVSTHSKETLNKARLTALYAICLQIFRHIAQKSLAIRQYACGISMQSAEKSDDASYAQALFSVSLKSFSLSSIQSGEITGFVCCFSAFFENSYKVYICNLPILPCSIVLVISGGKKAASQNRIQREKKQIETTTTGNLRQYCTKHSCRFGIMRFSSIDVDNFT